LETSLIIVMPELVNRTNHRDQLSFWRGFEKGQPVLDALDIMMQAQCG